jgi:hypothetical protein
MNTHSAREYTMFTPAQFLHNWHEQWPSNQGDLDSSVMGEVQESLLGGGEKVWDHFRFDTLQFGYFSLYLLTASSISIALSKHKTHAC